MMLSFSCASAVSLWEPAPEVGSLDREMSSGALRFLDLPVEIHTRILRLLGPMEVLAYGRTCKLLREYADNPRLWQQQWRRLNSKTPFTFLPTSTLARLGVNFKDCCRRLWCVMASYSDLDAPGATKEIQIHPVQCAHCRNYTCSNACIRDGYSQRVTVDIGGKITWVVTPAYGLERHLSMMAVSKTLKCYDCDTTLRRHDERAGGGNEGSYQYHHRHHHHRRRRSVSSHTALEYLSPRLTEKGVRPFCLFCEDDQVNHLRRERELVYSTRRRLKGTRCYPHSSFSAADAGDDDLDESSSSPLTNGYCRDAAIILGANNFDPLSPLLALEDQDAFPVVKAFLGHLLKRFGMVNDLQKPNSFLTLTEPGKLPLSVKESLLKFLFEEAKVARVCLLPKALAIAQLFDVSNCVVVDSGATCTYVWVVIDGRVDETKTQVANVGGWHVSQFLQDALTPRRDIRDTVGAATVSSFDTSAVKQKCRLSLNLAREGGSETLYIRSQKEPIHRGDTLSDYMEVTLSSELYLAPEMMYATLDLPKMVDAATQDLPDSLVKDCFSHILLTGGNTDLKGFQQRLSSDLRDLLPEHAPIINVCPFPTGNHSWNTVMGANAIQVPVPYNDNVFRLREAGTPLWVTREEFITFGSQLLATCQSEANEG